MSRTVPRLAVCPTQADSGAAERLNQLGACAFFQDMRADWCVRRRRNQRRRDAPSLASVSLAFPAALSSPHSPLLFPSFPSRSPSELHRRLDAIIATLEDAPHAPPDVDEVCRFATSGKFHSIFGLYGPCSLSELRFKAQG